MITTIILLFGYMLLMLLAVAVSPPENDRDRVQVKLAFLIVGGLTIILGTIQAVIWVNT